MCHLYEDGTAHFIDYNADGLAGYIDYVQGIINSNLPQPTMVAIEKVSAMPGQGVKSMFSFGQRFGELEGMLQTFKLGYDTIRPQLWQKSCQIVPKSGKKGIYQVMSRLYPTASLTGPRGAILDGRCDALGIAHYLRKTYP